MRKENGFTFIEVLVVVVTIGVLAAIAIPNYQRLQERSYNAVAKSDYTNIKTGVYADIQDIDDTNLKYFYYYSNGTTGNYSTWDGLNWSSGTFALNGELPGPLSELSLSKGTIPRIIYSYQFESLSYNYVWIDHERSNESYRIIDYKSPFFNLQTGDQVIQK